MKRMVIRNWDRWQSYRSDRGAPPWIKIHRKLLSNPEWSFLTDSEKGQLVSIWIIASDKCGEVPSDPNALKKVCALDGVPNVSKFIELGFMEIVGCQVGVKLASSGCQVDAPEESREEEITDTVENSARQRANIPFQKIVSFLNEKSGKDFKPQTKSTKTCIKARWAEGFKEEDFLVVISHKCEEWAADSKMCDYLRPQTLFGNKFEAYLQSAKKRTESNGW